MGFLKWFFDTGEEDVDFKTPNRVVKEFYGKEFTFRTSYGEDEEVLEIGVCGVNDLNKCNLFNIKEKLFKNLMNNKYLYKKYNCTSLLTGYNYISIKNIKTIDNTTHSDDGWDKNTITDIIYISGDNISDINLIYDFLTKKEVDNDDNREINNDNNKMKIKDVLMDFSCTIPINDYEYKIKVYEEKEKPDSFNVEISKKQTLYNIDELGIISDVKKRLNKYEKEWLEEFIDSIKIQKNINKEINNG